jgi:imidazolonepropionase-like amidohydrolase
MSPACTRPHRQARLLAILCLCLCTAAAQQASDFAIVNARVFDGFVVRDSASVVSRDGIIVAVLGSAAGVAAEIDTVIDGEGMTVVPGLINAHFHTRGSPNGLREAADAGVLTVIELFDSAEGAAKVRAYRGTPGYADIFSTGWAATVPGGYAAFPGAPTLQGPSEAARFVQDRIAEGSEFLKILVERGRGRFNRIDDDTIAALVAAAHSEGLLTVAHISTLEDAMAAFEAGVDGLAHFWMEPPTVLSPAELDLLSSRQFFITPTVLVWKLGQDTISAGFDLSTTLTNLMRLHDRGVTILAGTDPPNAGINFGTDLYRELHYFDQAGLSPTEVLKTATSNVASRYSLDDRGSIEPGRRADLLLIDGDPTTDITAIEKIVGIWQAGVRIR